MITINTSPFAYRDESSMPTLIPLMNGQPVPMPQATTATMPSMATTSQAITPTVQPGFTPMDLEKPMPSIVNTDPAVLGMTPCGGGFSGWVNDNPVTASLLLAGLAFALLGGRRL